MEPLLAFYHAQAPDHRGRWLHEIWRASPSWLEQTHDYMPWLFPLPEPSSVTPQAPLLTPACRQAFAADPALRQQMRHSLELMLDFWGIVDSGGEYLLKPHSHASTLWLARHNHNQLRLTRAIRSLAACHLLTEALQLQQLVLLLGQNQVNPHTLEYWRHALEGLGTG